MGTMTMDAAQLNRLREKVSDDIGRGKYLGAVIGVAHRGRTELLESYGQTTASHDARPLQVDDAFRVLSVTKSLTNVLVLQAIDRGFLSFNTKVADVIPEFVAGDRFRQDRKNLITVAHLLNHTAGLPSTPEPLPYDRMGNLSDVVESICSMDVVSDPGSRLVYSPAVNHALLGEIARRVYESDSFRSLLYKQVLDPTGMHNTFIGVPDNYDVVPITASFSNDDWLHAADLEALNDAVNGENELPWVGAVSTVPDMQRFAEMLRRGGEIDGARILSPAILDKATRNTTGSQPNDLFRRVAEANDWEVGPGNLGLGFPLAGDTVVPSIFGNLTSPRTFGGFGAGSTLWWVDPVRDLTFVCFTSGIMGEAMNIKRFQTLSDMTVSALTPDGES